MTKKVKEEGEGGRRLREEERKRDCKLYFNLKMERN